MGHHEIEGSLQIFGDEGEREEKRKKEKKIAMRQIPHTPSRSNV